MAESEVFKYFAFISYSHKDRKTAKELQKKLHQYHLPSEIQKSNPDLPENLNPVFIDESNLVGTGLQEALNKNLERSNYLIVICSPRSAKSEYVNDEVKYFIDSGRTDHIIPLIVEGVPHSDDPGKECFPPAVLELPRENELLGIDLQKFGKRRAFLRVIATMLRLDFENFSSFVAIEEKERRKRAAVFIPVSAAIAAIAGMFMPGSNYLLSFALFCLIQTAAFYADSGALVLRLGSDFLRLITITAAKLSEAFSKTSTVNLIFGINADSVTFGRNLAGEKGSILAYADGIISPECESSILKMGGAVYSDKDALTASPSFLKKLHIKPYQTRVRLYALSSERDKNFHYAAMMSDSLKRFGILPDQAGLLLRSADEWEGMRFQSSGTQYGYSNVISFNEQEMSAKLLIHEYPPCNTINFDANGRATEDFDAFIVGFGKMGHEVLRQIIADGQFSGSRFHATVYDPMFEQRAGFFRSRYPEMFGHYDIDFEPFSAKSGKFFRFLTDNADKLKYIVICLEDRDAAEDTALLISEHLGNSLDVYTCDSKSVRCYSSVSDKYSYSGKSAVHWIYDSEILFSGEPDRYAMELNHRYAMGSSAAEDWKYCDYFGRMSARAAVSLIPLIYRMMTDSADGKLTPEQRENLAINEHLRWRAFHYTFGYDVMDPEEFAHRMRDRRNEIEKYGRSSITPAADRKRKLHACLVDWDELDELSRIDSEITGGNNDYKDNDRIAADMVIDIMQSQIKEE